MKTVLLSIVLLFAAGCATVPVDVTTRGKETPGVDLTPIPVVRISPEFRARTDHESVGGFVYNTGEVFAKVFTGDSAAPGLIELLDAHRNDVHSPGWLMVDQRHISYSVTVRLTIGGKASVLTASGEQAGYDPVSLNRGAIEKAASALALQVREKLKSPDRS